MIDSGNLFARIPALLVLLVVLTVLLLLARIRAPWAPAYAAARGTLQLAVLAFVLSGAFSSVWWFVLFLLVMFSVAWWTAFRRARPLSRNVGVRKTVLVIGCALILGPLVPLAAIFGLGGLEFSPSYLLALGGIFIGASMSLSTLTVRRLHELLDDRWHEVEAWLALGATHRQATVSLARSAVYSALVPSTDQTRTTGLVTLPGAFVGAIFGGASPYQAGLFQVFVLVGILTCGSVVSVMVAMTLSPRAKKPA